MTSIKDNYKAGCAYYLISIVCVIVAIFMLKLDAYLVYFFDMQPYPIFTVLAIGLLVIGTWSLFLGMASFLEKDKVVLTV